MSPFALFAQYSLRRQSPVQSGVQRFGRHSDFSSPLFDVQCFSVERNRAIRPGIIGLYICRYPAAVARLIVAVAINAIESVAHTGARANVFQKGREGIAPTLTYFDTASAVKMIPGSDRVCAPLNHVRPNGILRCVNHSMMLFGLRPVAKAAACCGVSSSKTLSHYCYRPSAIASAQPCGFIPGNLADVSVNNQTAKPLASHVLYAFVRNGYNLVSHFRTSSTDMMRGLRGVRCALQSPLFYHNRVYGQLGQGPRIGS